MQNLTDRKPNNIDRGRSQMANKSVVDQHFKLLGDTLDRLGLKDKPNNVFNCDESMISMDKRIGQVVICRKTKHTYSNAKGSCDHITANACISLAGDILPSQIIFAESFPSGPHASDDPDEGLDWISKSDYMDFFMCSLRSISKQRQIIWRIQSCKYWMGMVHI